MIGECHLESGFGPEALVRVILAKSLIAKGLTSAPRREVLYARWELLPGAHVLTTQSKSITSKNSRADSLTENKIAYIVYDQ
jgi:hypothetical protein